MISTSSGRVFSHHTLHASVAGEQVSLEFTQTRLAALELGVRDADEAAATARAAPVGERQDVWLTAEVAHVELHAPAKRHAPVKRTLHQHDFVGAARRPEYLRVAVLAHVQLSCDHTQPEPEVLKMRDRKWRTTQTAAWVVCDIAYKVVKSYDYWMNKRLSLNAKE